MSGTRPTVLHVVEAVEGGTIRHVADLVRSVSGFSHVVAAPARRSTGLTDSTAIDTISRHARLVPLPLTRSPLSLTNLRAAAQLRRVVQSEGASLVHAHSTVAGLAVRSSELPVPVIYTPNGLQPTAIVERIERYLGRRTDAFIAVSSSEAAHVRARGIVPADRIWTIPNGIAPERPAEALNLRSHLGLSAGTPLFGTAIRLVRQKAPQDFVLAAARVLWRHPDARAVLMGDGPLRRRVERAAASVDHSDRIHLLGHLPDAATVLSQLDVFVLQSRFEGMPYALLEAMQAGVAVVATDVRGNRDAIVHDTSGVLVPVDDVTAAATAISRLLSDADLRSRLGAAAATRVAEEFSLTSMAAAHEELYDRLLGGVGAR